MKNTVYLSLLFFAISYTLFSQSVDDPFPKEKMRKDFEVYKAIRKTANSGLYKYRTPRQIDSIYNWANKQIGKSSTYGDFYNIICQISDFEGSTHNYDFISQKSFKLLKKEDTGYFPYPIKWIEGKWIINYNDAKLPLGSEIIAIDDKQIDGIVKDLYKYYSTDGINTTGKIIGINRNFSRYYRLNYGLKTTFQIRYKAPNSDQIESSTLQSIGYADYYKKFDNRYSKPFDNLDYLNPDQMAKKYTYKKLDNQTGVLTINTFSIGGHAEDPEHKIYLQFLDSVFSSLKNIKNLIVDVRHNGGGSDPNDLVTYSYIADRNFSENKQAYISFKKIPYLKYIESKIPPFLRPFGVIKYNKWLQKEFYIEKENRYYQGPLSDDHKIRTPNNFAFKGNVYLLISPRVASAGSLFAAMAAGNKNTTVIGQETMGGYYGHNGHSPITYILPKSKIVTSFFLVNLKQDVLKKENQIENRGIIPDYDVSQTYEDYLLQKDTQMNFSLNLIKEKANL